MIWQGKLAAGGAAVEVEADAVGRINGIRPLPGGEQPGLPYISAGWTDLQVNGFGGYDLNADITSPEDVAGVTRALHKRGVAAYLPTVITGSYERMRQAMAAVAAYCGSGCPEAKSIWGIHMEGPYLSGEDGSRGAHPREHIRNPGWEEFQRLQEAAGGLIRMVTLAPEREGAIPFIRRLTDSGVVVAIGHTMASGEEIEAAVEAGATVSTHLGNGSQPLLPRHPNYIWHQLAEDRLWGTFIPDGHHLAPPVLKVMLRAKGSRSVLVSDCTQFGGMAPGRYQSLIGGEVELLENERLQTAANPAILAGSAVSLDSGIANALRYTDMELAEAVEAITERPAKVMGMANRGVLAEGAVADLTLFDYDPAAGGISVRETVVAGTRVYSRTGASPDRP